MNEILIIDDEISICDSLTFLLEDEYKVFSSINPIEGFKIIEDNNIDLVLLDLKIGEYNGLEFIPKIKSFNKSIQIIMMTAHGSIKSSVEAMKLGATHYITKPLDSEELLVLVESSINLRKLTGKVDNLQQIIEEKYNSQGIVGNSIELNNVFKKVSQVKDLDSTVLITGESGTGKDLIAKALHYDSIRKNENLEIVNCAAIPTDLLESELFGYEKGAFTGADKNKLGKIELANKGTLFLDEIGEMDINLQAKILRVVEDMKISPLGSETTKQVNVRIVAATNKNLEEEVEKGNFRNDLYYRLNIINLKLPSLRDRKEDIPLLIDHFIKIYSKKFNKNIKGLDKEAENILKYYPWPGNIRELENLIERILVFQENEYIGVSDIPEEYICKNISSSQKGIFINYGETLLEAEKKIIIETLNYNFGNRKDTAEILGISLRNLQYKIKEYNL